MDTGLAAFGFEHGGYSCGGIVAEELTESFFVESDVMFADESDEVGGCVAGERGAGEVGIFGNKIFGGAVEVGEVAAASAGDEDFFADAIGAFDERDAAGALGRFGGAEEAGGTGAEDDGVVGVGWVIHGEKCDADNEWERYFT